MKELDNDGLRFLQADIAKKLIGNWFVEIIEVGLIDKTVI